MSQVNLKIKISSPGNKDQDQTKMFRYDINLPIEGLLKDIRDKIGDTGTGKDHGLFQPASKERPARWLKANRTLKYYNMNTGAEMEYRKKHRVQKVQLMDDTVKAILIDSSKPVSNIIKTIGEKLGLKNSEEFSLRPMNSETAWLIEDKTLHEQEVKEEDILVFAIKYFSTAFNVDREDPMLLHLVFIQSVSAVINGKYDPLQRSEAVDLAAVQMQITHGSHDPNKHKAGFLDLNKFLPLSWRKTKQIELDIYKEHKKLVGTTDTNAKYRYVQLVRSLKSFGITFYTLAERVKGKKKPVPCFIGITRDKIVKLDGETREVVKEWEIHKLRRWAPTANTFTLDFGDYEGDYLVFQTEEGEAISALIAGYIDILLKAQQEGGGAEDDDDGDEAKMESVAPQFGMAMGSFTHGFTGPSAAAMTVPSHMMMGMVAPSAARGSVAQGFSIDAVGGMGMAMMKPAFPNAQKINVMDLTSALAAARALSSDLNTGLEGWDSQSNLTADQWRHQMGTYLDGVNTDIAKLLAQARIDPKAASIDGTAKSLAQQVLGMAIAAKNVAALEGNAPLLGGAKAVSESIARLLAGVDRHAKDPNDPTFTFEMIEAEKALKASVMSLEEARKAHYIDKGAEMIMLECVNDINVALDEMISSASDGASQLTDPNAKKKVNDEVDAAKAAKEWLVGSISAMTPVSIDPNIKVQLHDATTSVSTIGGKLVTAGRNNGLNADAQHRLDFAARRLNDALKLLLQSSDLGENRGAEGELDMDTPANILIAALSQIRKNTDNPAALVQPTKTGLNASNTLVRSTKRLADTTDDATRERLLKTAKNMGDSMGKMLDAVRVLTKNPQDANAKSDIMDLATKLEAFTQDIISDAGVTAALTGLRYYAKASTAKMFKLNAAATSAMSSIYDDATRNSLWQLGNTLADQISQMVGALSNATKEPDNFVRQNELLMTTKTNIPGFHGYLVEALKSQKHISDLNKKQDVTYAVTEAQDAIKKLEKACQSVSDIGGQTEIEEALQDFDAVNVDLDAAEFAASQGLLAGVPGQTRENAQELLALATRSLLQTIDALVEASKTGGRLPAHVKEAASAIGQVAGAVRSMASTVADRPTQKRVIAAAKETTTETMHLIASGRILAIDRTNPDKLKNIDIDHSKVRSTLATLLAASKGLDARECDEAVAAIRADQSRINNKTPTASSFKQASEALASVAKAWSAAVSQLVAMARSNPRGVGSAAKITGATNTQLVNAVNVAASTAGDENLSQEIMKSATTLSSNLIDLLNAAKGAAANRDAESIEVLNQNSTKTNDSLQALVTSLGSAGSPECDDAIRIIMEAITLLDSGKLDGIAGKTRAQLLEEFTAASQGLAQATTIIITACRMSVAKLGAYSKEAATTVSALVDSVRSAMKAPAAGGGGANSELLAPAIDIIKCCQLVIANPSDMAKAVAVAKKVALSASKLISNTKTLAGSVEDKAEQQKILRAAKAMADNASRLAKAVQIAGTSKTQDAFQQMVQCATDLKTNTQILEEAASGSSASAAATPGSVDGVEASVSQQLSAASKVVAVSTSELIRAASGVSVNKTSDAAAEELSKATKTMTEAIAGLMAAYASLNPGIQECSRTEEMLTAASGDFDGLSLQASTGTMTLTNSSNKTFAQLLEDLVDLAKAIGDDIVSTTSAARQGKVQGLIDAAKKMQTDSNHIITSSKNAIAAAPTKEWQTAIITLNKNLSDALAQLMRHTKAFNPTDKTTSDNLNSFRDYATAVTGQMISSLQSNVNLMRDIEKVREELGRHYHSMETAPETAASKRYGDYREEVTGSNIRTLSDLVNKMTTTTAESVGQLSMYANRLGESSAKFTSNIRSARATTNSAEAQKEIATTAKEVVHMLCGVLDAAKAFAGEPTNPIQAQKMRVSVQPVTTAMGKLVAALKKGAIGEVMCDQALDTITKSINHLNTTSIFAQAGQLEPEKAAMSQTMSALQTALAEAGKALSAGSSKVIDGAKAGSEQLGNSAKSLSTLVGSLSTSATTTASRMPDSNSQSDVLGAAKMVAIRAQQLILAARDAERSPNDQSVQNQLTSAQASLKDAISNMEQVVQNAMAGAAAGERELESAKKSIIALATNVAGFDAATPQDVIKAARQVTAVVPELVFSVNQEEIVAAARKSLEATDKLLNSAFAASKLAPDQASAQNVQHSALKSANAMTKLLEVSKLSRQDPQTQQQREDAASEVTGSLNGLVQALRALPDAANLSLDEGQDLEDLAAKELKNAAEEIAKATQTLMSMRPARKAKADPNVLTDEDIADAIFAASIAISQATGTLVVAAAASQAERTEKNKLPGGKKYNADPTWASGLVSAAKAVAGSVKQLVQSANKVATGKADQEELIVSARGVAASTAQLVAASRAKADPLSKAQKQLGEAAKSVTGATSDLVKAAQSAALREEEGDVELEGEASMSMKQKFDQQIKILKLEAQIEAERKRLSKMNKDQYAGASAKR